MSCFRLCDGDDCDNTENDTLYEVPHNIKEFMQANYPYWKYYNNASDLCSECVAGINENFPENNPLVEIDDTYTFQKDIKIAKVYLDNPSLVKGIE